VYQYLIISHWVNLFGQGHGLRAGVRTDRRTDGRAGGPSHNCVEHDCSLYIIKVSFSTLVLTLAVTAESRPPSASNMSSNETYQRPAYYC